MLDRRFILKKEDVQRVKIDSLEAIKTNVKQKYKRRTKVERLKHAKPTTNPTS